MQNELENIYIRAPFDGFFNDNLSEVGDFLSIGMPCGHIIDYDPILVTGQISEQEIKKVKTTIRNCRFILRNNNIWRSANRCIHSS